MIFNAGCEEDARFGDETNPGFLDDAVEGRVHCGDDCVQKSRRSTDIILQNASTQALMRNFPKRLLYMAMQLQSLGQSLCQVRVVFSGSPKFHEGNNRSVEADQVLMRLLTRLHPHRLFPFAWTRSRIRGITTSFMWSIVTQVSIYCGVRLHIQRECIECSLFHSKKGIFQPLRCDP